MNFIKDTIILQKHLAKFKHVWAKGQAYSYKGWNIDVDKLRDDHSGSIAILPNKMG